jgi:hypothetical protein
MRLGSRSWTVSVGLVVLLLAAATALSACASDSLDAAAYDLEGARTCDDLADMYIGSQQRMLEALGTRTDADMEGDIPTDIQAASAEVAQWIYGSGGERVEALCWSGMDEIEWLVCEQAATFEAQGEAGERHLRDNIPTCD